MEEVDEIAADNDCEHRRSSRGGGGGQGGHSFSTFPEVGAKPPHFL